MMQRTLEAGWLPESVVTHCPAEKKDWGYRSFPEGSLVPSALVQHIAEGYYEYFSQIANDGKVGPVSCHLAIARDGRAGQFVSLRDAAWHAGRLDINRPRGLPDIPPTWSEWRKGVSPNKYTIGLEMGGFTGKPFTEVSIAKAVEIIAFIWNEQEQIWDGNTPLGLRPTRYKSYIGHSEIAPGSRCE